ncbi:probable malonyl-CoA-acyl carrier protein transacylase, mitochondrial [Argiope bruennichi]|uniref:probable malonyl-CoA-acyl carrier protein transacylase, mitochondrial n=1 Tax=Argiope bruennichi TaxID=94029 RepID=UPI002493D4C4|nr:probable malonyl-CoA-acyl carrier protein transacylase, mitochondrial [Argiope bruennichi]
MSYFQYSRFFKTACAFCRFRSLSFSAHLNCSKGDPPKVNLKHLVEGSASFTERDPETDQWHTPVYPKKRLQSTKSFRPNVDPTTTSVILFPGQGSQYVGMGKSLLEYPQVKEMFDCASEILKYNLLDLCMNGPEDMLNMTVHSQVAVMVASLAAIEKLRVESEEMINNCVATAGFSVGEYSALVFSGALEFENAVRLLKIRGEAMQAASDAEPSGMMTVFLSPGAKIKLACKEAREWCEQQTLFDAECKVAIYLFPDCKVVAGHLEALKFLESNAAKYGIKKLKYLPVSGAFHTKVMKPAKQILQKALKATPFEVPLIPVHSNVDGNPYGNVDQIRMNLAEQLCKPVRWEQIMHIIFERSQGMKFPNVFECGPGTSMKTILRMNNRIAYDNCKSILA